MARPHATFPSTQFRTTRKLGTFFAHMNWHYAVGSEQRGPFLEKEIRQLIAAGTITPTTLVWRTGLSNWRAAKETELFGPVAPVSDASADQHRCIITGKFYPTAQIVQTPDGPVSYEGKDLYYQSRREGAPLPFAAGIGNARASGKYVVVPVEGAKLPLRCIKTNAVVTAAEAKSKTLYWFPPLLALTILLNLLIFLVLYLIFRKRVKLDIPLSAEGRRQLRKHALIAWAAVVVGVVCIFIIVAEPQLAWLILPGFLLILFGAIYGGFRATTLRVGKLRNGEAWLRGASREFIASLPTYH